MRHSFAASAATAMVRETSIGNTVSKYAGAAATVVAIFTDFVVCQCPLKDWRFCGVLIGVSRFSCFFASNVEQPGKSRCITLLEYHPLRLCERGARARWATTAIYQRISSESIPPRTSSSFSGHWPDRRRRGPLPASPRGTNIELASKVEEYVHDENSGCDVTRASPPLECRATRSAAFCLPTFVLWSFTVLGTNQNLLTPTSG